MVNILSICKYNQISLFIFNINVDNYNIYFKSKYRFGRQYILLTEVKVLVITFSSTVTENWMFNVLFMMPEFN